MVFRTSQVHMYGVQNIPNPLSMVFSTSQVH